MYSPLDLVSILDGHTLSQEQQHVQPRPLRELLQLPQLLHSLVPVSVESPGHRLLPLRAWICSPRCQYLPSPSQRPGMVQKLPI